MYCRRALPNTSSEVHKANNQVSPYFLPLFKSGTTSLRSNGMDRERGASTYHRLAKGDERREEDGGVAEAHVGRRHGDAAEDRDHDARQLLEGEGEAEGGAREAEAMDDGRGEGGEVVFAEVSAEGEHGGDGEQQQRRPRARARRGGC